ncbi:helix-turn-helix domain-containing protein [Saccharopolyspora shandongensis]|uniref:helix-turn-helix domain-containing protein n=1 Tax=Saccharopolyspora shandongensis TaxID=418495 RepID=UPI003F4E020A
MPPPCWRWSGSVPGGDERHSTVEVLLTLAEELHFGRTAERLHITTGRVSQCIKALECRVGAALFERTSRRVALTPIGPQLGDQAKALRPVMDLPTIRVFISREPSKE